MDFRTVVNGPDGLIGAVTHCSPIVLLGSCFTDNVGACLRDDLFDVTVNPFGPLYNPESVARAVAILADKSRIEPDLLFRHEGRYHSFFFHSRYSGRDREATARLMSDQIRRGHEALCRAGLLVVTLGTTRVFRCIDSNFVVANCHKLPAGEFDEDNLSLEQCIVSIESIVDVARCVNQSLKFIFTVSPLRYMGRGAHANAVSKATLMLAIDDVMARYEGVYYFPSYEIMMDDLRDYRFYAEDMKHPTAQAVKYIYERFCEACFTDSTRETAERARRLTRRLAHRPMGGDGGCCDDKTRLIEEFKKANPALASTLDRYISDEI